MTSLDEAVKTFLCLFLRNAEFMQKITVSSYELLNVLAHLKFSEIFHFHGTKFQTVFDYGKTPSLSVIQAD